MSPWEQAMAAMREDEAMRFDGMTRDEADAAEALRTAKEQKSDEEFAKSPLFRECVRSMTKAANSEGI